MARCHALEGLDLLKQREQQNRIAVSFFSDVVERAESVSSISEEEAKSYPGYYEYVDFQAAVAPLGVVRYKPEEIGIFPRPGMPKVSVGDVVQKSKEISCSGWLFEKLDRTRV